MTNKTADSNISAKTVESQAVSFRSSCRLFVCKSTSKEYRCWLILSTFSWDILSFVLTFLWPPGECWGKWKRCHGILEAPRKSDLHGLAAVMAYIMEFMACRGLLPIENASPHARLLNSSLLQTAAIGINKARKNKGRNKYIMSLSSSLWDIFSYSVLSHWMLTLTWPSQ